MLLNRTLSVSSSSWTIVGWSARYKPYRRPRRRKTSRRCLSDALVKPQQELEAYVSDKFQFLTAALTVSLPTASIAYLKKTGIANMGVIIFVSIENKLNMAKTYARFRHQ